MTLYCEMRCVAGTEMVQPFARNGVTDMFWSQPWDFEGMASGCQAEWGTTPQQYWATVNVRQPRISFKLLVGMAGMHSGVTECRVCQGLYNNFRKNARVLS